MTKELTSLIHRHIKEKDVLEADRLWNQILPYWDDDKEEIINLLFSIESERIEKLSKKKVKNGCQERSIFDS